VLLLGIDTVAILSTRLTIGHSVRITAATAILSTSETPLEIGCILSGAALMLGTDFASWAGEDITILRLLTRLGDDSAASARANRGRRLTLLHVVNATLCDADIIEGALAGRVAAMFEATEARLRQPQAGGLGLSGDITDGLRLELDHATGAQHESADLQIEGHFFLMLMDSIEHLVTEELKHGLNKVSAAVCHLCNGREACRDKLLVKYRLCHIGNIL